MQLGIELNPATGRMEPARRSIKPDRSGRQAHVSGTQGHWFAALRAKGVVPPTLDPKKLAGRHKGETIFVLGCGPSLRLAARHRRELRRVTTIGTNLSFLEVESDYLFFLDKTLWTYSADELLTLETTILHGAFLKSSKEYLPWFTKVKGSRRKPTPQLSRDIDKGLYIHGIGIASLNLAVVMGAKRICLLGIDLYDKSHFFSGRERLYGSRQVNEFVPRWLTNNAAWKDYPRAQQRLADWKQIAVQLKKFGIECINCSPKSRLDMFPKKTVAQALALPAARKHVDRKWGQTVRNWVLKTREASAHAGVKLRTTSTMLFTADEIHNRHRGGMLFVFGNGPSLLQAENYKKLLAREVCIGVNSSYLLLPSDYLVFSDHFLWTYCSEALLRLKTHIFCQKRRDLPFFNQWPKFHPSSKDIAAGHTLSMSWQTGLYKGISSMAAAANLAFLFGAKAIVLLGLDMNSPHHFYTGDRRFAKDPLVAARHKWWGRHDKKKSYPNTQAHMEFWKNIARSLENQGVTCINASMDSKVECFEKMPLERILEMKDAILARPVEARDPLPLGKPTKNVRPKPWDRKKRG